MRSAISVRSYSATDLEQELVMRVLGHRPVEELDATTVFLQLLEQKYLMNIVTCQPIRVGDEDLVE
jgi:hypothetical protein